MVRLWSRRNKRRFKLFPQFFLMRKSLQQHLYGIFDILEPSPCPIGIEIAAFSLSLSSVANNTWHRVHATQKLTSSATTHLRVCYIIKFFNNRTLFSPPVFFLFHRDFLIDRVWVHSGDSFKSLYDGESGRDNPTRDKTQLSY